MPADTRPTYYLYGSGKKVHIENPLNMYDTFCGLAIYSATPVPVGTNLDLGDTPFTNATTPIQGVDICTNCWWSARDARFRVQDLFASRQKEVSRSKYVERVRDISPTKQEELLAEVMDILDNSLSAESALTQLDEMFEPHRATEGVLTVELRLTDLRPQVADLSPDELKLEVGEMVSRTIHTACWWDNDSDYEVLTATFVEE